MILNHHRTLPRPHPSSTSACPLPLAPTPTRHPAHPAPTPPTPPIHPPQAALGLKSGVVSSGNSLDYTDKCMEIMTGHGAALKEMEAAAIAWACALYKVGGWVRVRVWEVRFDVRRSEAGKETEEGCGGWRARAGQRHNVQAPAHPPPAPASHTACTLCHNLC